MDTPHGGWREAGFEALGEEGCLDLVSLRSMCRREGTNKVEPGNCPSSSC